jgi:hypothetical protein
MKDMLERGLWADYFDEFNKRNQARPTWLQVFGEMGAQSEEQGLPLAGISLEDRGVDAPRVQIMLGGTSTIQEGHLTHMMANVERIAPQLGADGRDEAIEFVDKQGQTSLLIFKHRARLTIHAAAGSPS